MDLPDLIRADLEDVIDGLSRRGWSVSEHEVGPMHSYRVRFSGPRLLAVVCDRGQLSVEGAGEDLEPVGMFRVFDDREAFARALWKYLD